MVNRNFKKFLSKILMFMLVLPVFTSVVSASVLDEQQFRITVVEVNSSSGVPELYINGEKTPMIMFTQWKQCPESNDFENYANYEGNARYAGIKIYQPRAYGETTLSDWTPFLDDILSKDPNAYFFLPIWVQNPDDFGFVANADNEPNIDTSAKYSSTMGSLKWRQMAGQYVRQRVREFTNSKFRDRILGYMLTAGNTGEWFDINTYDNPSPDFDRSLPNTIGFRNWLKSTYVTDAALRTAWNNQSVTLDTAVVPAKVTNGPFLDPNTYQNVIDFMKYDSIVVAQSIEYLCSVVKDETENTRIVGVPYGYTMETGKYGNIGGSLAFSYLLNSTSLDFICSPLAYHHRELIDYTGWHGFADSCRLHNKLWLSEDDTPTYLNSFPAYNWYKHINNLNDSKAALWKDFMAATTKKFGTWWFDNYGQGQLNSPELVYEIATMNSLAQAANDKSYSNGSQVALVVDENSEFYQTPGAITSNGRYSFNDDLAYFRYYMGQMGAPFDVISMDDIVQGLAGNYKMYVFANAYALTSAQRTAIRALRNNNRGLVFIKTPGLIDIDTKAASYTALQDITWFDLRLASSSNNSQVSYGSGLVDAIGNLTEVNLNTLFTGFTNSSRPHMFGYANPGDTVLATAPDGKAVALKSPKTGWISYWADDISLLTPSILRGICNDAGVFVYSTNNRPVSADNRFVAVTLPGGGTTEGINFPYNGTVYEVISDTEYTVANNTLTVDASQARTYVFYLGTRATLGMARPVAPGTVPYQFKLSRDDSTLVTYPSSTYYVQLDPDIMTIDGLDVADRYTVTWSSDNSAIATVDSAGKVKGVSVGTTTIRASAAGLSGSRTVQVVAANTFDHIQFAGTMASINKGSNYTITTLQTVSIDGTTTTLGNSLATWTSSNTAIATVNSSGVVNGVYDGAATITATYNGKTAKLAVNVNDTVNIPRDIWFTNSNGYVRFDTISGTYSLNVHAVDKYTVETDITSTTAYTSSNTSVATVSSTGVITPVGYGTALITAGAYGKKAYCQVDAGRLRINPVNVTISASMTAGQSQTPTATATAPVTGMTSSWSLLKGNAVQITGGGSLIQAVYTGASKVQGNINYSYPQYNVSNNTVTSDSGQTRPVYTINVTGATPPPMPTPAPLYSENFDDGLAQNWTAYSGTWTVVSGEYDAPSLSNGALAYYNNASFSDFKYKGTARFIGSSQVDMDIIFRYQDSSNYYQAHIGKGSQMMTIYKCVNNTFTMIGSQVAYNPPTDVNISFSIVAKGNTISFTMYDGTTYKTSTAIDNTFASGKIGLKTYLSHVRFDNIEVWNAPAYIENFDDNQAQGWAAVSGNWAVEGYELSAPSTNTGSIAYYAVQDFDNFTYKGTARFIGGTQVDVDIIFRYQDSGNYYQAHIGKGSQVMTIYKCVNNTFTMIGNQVAYNPPTDTSIYFAITCNGSSISFTTNDGTTTKTSSATDAAFTTGKIGLKTYLSHCHYDQLEVSQ